VSAAAGGARKATTRGLRRVDSCACITAGGGAGLDLTVVDAGASELDGLGPRPERGILRSISKRVRDGIQRSNATR
jgi:hypothetical protein